jgi:hypothetical protein
LTTIYKIQRVDNGFRLFWNEEYDEGGTYKKEFVFEEKEDTIDEDKQEKSACIDTLYMLIEELGLHYSKHNKFNIKIGLEEKKE